MDISIQKEILKSVETRILVKSTGKIDISKLQKILVVEESFEEELVKMPEIQAAANMPESVRFTYLSEKLGKFFGRATIPEVENVLSKMKLSSSGPVVYDNDNLRAIAKDKDEYISLLETSRNIEREVNMGVLMGGRPTVLMDTACKKLNKQFNKKGIDAIAIPKPKKSDYISRGLSKPYKGNEAADVLIVYTNKKGVTTTINMEYFGWTGESYEKGIVTKAEETAEKLEHLHAVIAPNYADNEAALGKFTSELYNKYGSKEVSALEGLANHWVLANDKYVGVTPADALYEMFYAVLDELGLAKKVMPASKVALFKR